MLLYRALLDHEVDPTKDLLTLSFLETAPPAPIPEHTSVTDSTPIADSATDGVVATAQTDEDAFDGWCQVEIPSDDKSDSSSDPQTTDQARVLSEVTQPIADISHTPPTLQQSFYIVSDYEPSMGQLPKNDSDLTRTVAAKPVQEEEVEDEYEDEEEDEKHDEVEVEDDEEADGADSTGPQARFLSSEMTDLSATIVNGEHTGLQTAAADTLTPKETDAKVQLLQQDSEYSTHSGVGISTPARPSFAESTDVKSEREPPKGDGILTKSDAYSVQDNPVASPASSLHVDPSVSPDMREIKQSDESHTSNSQTKDAAIADSAGNPQFARAEGRTQLAELLIALNILPSFITTAADGFPAIPALSFLFTFSVSTVLGLWSQAYRTYLALE